jgi:hypothetical protein
MGEDRGRERGGEEVGGKECVCVCVCVCERERVCVCVCERERERERETQLIPHNCAATIPLSLRLYLIHTRA